MELNIKIQKGTKENLKIARNLVHYYIYDMGIPMGWDPREDGVFDGCDEMAENWTNEKYHSYLIYNGEIPIGFAVVKELDENEIEYEIEEFFVLRRYRKKNIGKKIAVKLFESFKGRWQIRILKQNTPAISFWKRVLTTYTNNKYKYKEIIYKCPYSGNWEMIKYTFNS